MVVMPTNHKFTESEARCYITEQHAHYYQHLRYFAMAVGFKPNDLPSLPAVKIVDAVNRYCGQYHPATNTCEYSLPFCVYEGEQYNETIAHEVCHCIHPRLYGKSDPVHGKNFLWLLRDVCKFPKSNAKFDLTFAAAQKILLISQELIEMRAAAGSGGANDIVLAARGNLRSMIEQLNKRIKQ